MYNKSAQTSKWVINEEWNEAGKLHTTEEETGPTNSLEREFESSLKCTINHVKRILLINSTLLRVKNANLYNYEELAKYFSYLHSTVIKWLHLCRLT
jgi:hypothetical protein